MKKKITLLFAIAILFTVQGFAAVKDVKAKIESSNSFINCPIPVNVVLSNITSTSVDFSWTGTAGSLSISFYQYCVVSSQTPVEGPTTTNLTGSSYFSLAPGTAYYVYVREMCIDGVWSDWSVPATFTTPCNLATLPYSENFESTTAGSLPPCTTVVNEGAVTANNWTTVANPGSGFENNTLKYTGTTEAANAWFFTKGVTLVEGTKYKISYKYGNNSETTSEKLKVIAATSPNVTSLLTDLVFGNFTTINTGVAQTNAVGPFTALTGVSVYYFGFQAYSDANQGNLYLDDILIEEWVCGIPSSPTISEITSNGVTLSWNSTGENTPEVYQYAIVTSNETPQSGEFWPGTTITVNTLEPETTYYVYVRAMCSGVISDWTEVISFTTAESLSVSESVFDTFIVYPNPVKDVLTLSNKNPIDSVEIYNALGQIVFSQHYDALNVYVNMLDFSSGCYFLKVYSGEFAKTVRIVRN